MSSEKISDFFGSKAKEMEKWLRRNSYYSRQIARFMRFHIPPGSSVLEIGSGTGFLLNELSPKEGVGIDFSRGMIKAASVKYPLLKFVCADAVDYRLKGKFDYIILSDTIGYFDDIQKVLRNIRQNCTHRTRVIISYYSHLWEPLLKAAEFLHLKMKQPFTSWLSASDIAGLLYLEDFDIVKSGEKILFPKDIPLLSSFCNKYLANLPILRKLCLVNFVIARPLNLKGREDKRVSVVIAARNEKGNIENIVRALPELGKNTEIIFIEGGSKDNTWEEILRIKGKYRQKNIICAKQDGKGKGDAVRKGFDIAKGDILMIYDADMTVPAGDLKKFYDAIASNKGEFINGSRLVYPMEKEAMRTLNLFGNKMFSMMFSWLLGQRIKDTLCGTKVISKENYNVLKKNRSYFGNFDPFGDFDLLFGASKMDLKIVEIPIRYKERTYGQTNIRRIAHGWLLIKMCLFAMRRIKFI